MKCLITIFLLFISGCSTVNRVDSSTNKNTYMSDMFIKISQEDIRDRVEAERFERLLLNKKEQ